MVVVEFLSSTPSSGYKCRSTCCRACCNALMCWAGNVYSSHRSLPVEMWVPMQRHSPTATIIICTSTPPPTPPPSPTLSRPRTARSSPSFTLSHIHNPKTRRIPICARPSTPQLACTAYGVATCPMERERRPTSSFRQGPSTSTSTPTNR
jgi:hypothetical protein